MPDWRDILRTHLRKHEGFVPHMYLCTAGGLTIGIGHLIVSSADSSDPVKLQSGLRRLMRSEYELTIPLPPIEPVQTGPAIMPWSPAAWCSDPLVLRTRCGVLAVPPTSLEVLEAEAIVVLQDRTEQLTRVRDGDKSTKAYSASRWNALTRCRMSEAGALRLKDADISEIMAQVKAKFAGFSTFPDGAKIAVMDLAFQYGAGGANKHFGTAISKQDWKALAAVCASKGQYVDRNKARADFLLAAAKTVEAAAVK
jgi:GH24 family phage-related lysozyme (muramidase)